LTWLTDATIAELAKSGVRRLAAVMPGFSADCLETLEEIAMMLAARVAERGGQLRYIPCLNASATHADALASIARRALQSWG